jgi:phenylpropionate dioxygenase-like ring-hydroxylating dioxygenase large terminal subunit
LTTTTADPQSGEATGEDRPTLANYWHPIGTVADVTEEPKPFMLLGNPLVAYRDKEGPVCFDDLCIHRGARLSGGWVTDGRITCPYHGWEYDRTGACVRIPALPEGQSIPRKARAFAHQVQERYGLVWVAMAEPVAPIPSFPNDAWDSSEYKNFLASRYIWKTTAGRATENFMDYSHFPFVHPGSLGSPDDPVVEPTRVTSVEEHDFGISYAYEQKEPGELYAGEGMSRYEYSLYVPFCIHFKRIQPDGNTSIITLITAPVDSNHAELFLFISRDFGHDQPDADFKDYSDVIMEQDRVVVEGQRPEQIPVDLREELHLKVPDAPSLAYRRRLSEIDDTNGQFVF